MIKAGRVVNIASHLPRLAAVRPDAPAVYVPRGGGRYAHYTYDHLDRESNRLARGLAAAGVGRGTRTVLMVSPSLEFYALSFALFKAGAVPVLVDPGMGARNLKICLAEARPEAFIGISKAHSARIVLGWAKDTLRVRVTVGRRWLWGGLRLEDVRHDDDSPVLAQTRCAETAAILFTSGSTGVPKGAVYTHGIFAAQVDILRRIYRIEPGEIDLPTFPLFALFGPALGMTSVTPEMDFARPAKVDGAKIARAIRKFGVTQMFGSPALIDRVGRYLDAARIDLPSLKRVISAGAPVSAAVIERFSKHLAPGAQIHTPYGATEALPVSSIGSAEILAATGAATARGEGVCVGKPVAEMDVRIIKITDEPVGAWQGDLESAPGEVGEIAVRGPVATREYFNRGESTALAKIPIEGGGFYHRMGDLGRFDEEGRLWFYGRKAHRVELKSGTLFSVACEGVFNAHPQVYRTALVGVPGEGGRRPVLCVELEKSAGGADQDELKSELLALGAKREHTRGIKTILFHGSFPVDIRHNAKIFRAELAVWAAGQLA